MFTLEEEEMSKIELKVIANGEIACAGGKCPTIYKGTDGKFYIQGYVVKEEIKLGASLGGNEDLVEISSELIEAIRKI